MVCHQILPWALLLVASGPLWAHPITDSAERPYSGPVSVEDQGVGSLDELSLSEQTFPLQDPAGLRYASLLASELNREGVDTQHTQTHTHDMNTIATHTKNKATHTLTQISLQTYTTFI
uniref:Urotensin 2, alpha n=1 Tax=Gadus morhua TaxID=8049 RepID=A0A8C5BCI8_GADMO